MSVSPEELADLVLYQAGAVRAFAEAAGAELRHVKPHGAMYSMVVDDPELAAALCETVAGLGVALLMPPQLAAAAAAAGIRFVPEGYVDLDYDEEGKLILERVKQPRDPAETAERALRFASEGQVESICIHGDGPNAVELAAAVRSALQGSGVAVAPL
jgi:5-oxoprolinase (ATP-hydrolysing) subunit A